MDDADSQRTGWYYDCYPNAALAAARASQEESK